MTHTTSDNQTKSGSRRVLWGGDRACPAPAGGPSRFCLTFAGLGLALVLAVAPTAQSQVVRGGTSEKPKFRVRAETDANGRTKFVVDPVGRVIDLKKLEDERREQVAALPGDVKQRIENAKKSVGVVRGARSMGSGFVVGPNLFATNSHVIAGEAIADLAVQFVTANDPNPKRLPVALVYEDRTQDLALLRVETDRPALPLAADDVQAGLKLAVIGNPAEFNAAAVINSVSVGTYVETVQRKDRGRGYYRIDAYAEKGNSGGPVISQASGAVVGVLTYGERALIGKDNYCVPLPALRAAVAAVGSPAEWSKRAEAQAAVHAAFLVYDTLAEFDTEALTATALWVEMVRADSRRFPTPQGAFDGVDVVADLGKQMQDNAQRTKKLVAAFRTSPHLPPKTRKGLEAMQADAEQLAELIAKIDLVRLRTTDARVKAFAEQFARQSTSLAKQLAELNPK